MVRKGYNEFEDIYNSIRASACERQACSVLIFVALEVDGMAATKILTQLLRSDNIAYNLRPVSNFDELLIDMKDLMTADIKTVVLINCGAIYDLPKHFELDTGVNDFRVVVLDNHRPLHLKNVYSREKVIVVDDAIETADDEMDFDDIPSEISDIESQSESDNAFNLNSDTEDEEDEEGDDFEDEYSDMDGGKKYGEDEEFVEEGDDVEAEDAEVDEEDNDGGSQAEDADDEDDHDVTTNLYEDEDDEEGEDAGSTASGAKRTQQSRRSRRSELDTTVVHSHDEDSMEDVDNLDTSHVTADMHRAKRSRNQHEEEEEDEEDDDFALRKGKQKIRQASQLDDADEDNAEFEGEENMEVPVQYEDEEDEDFGPMKRHVSTTHGALNQEDQQRKEKRQRVQQYYRRAVSFSWPTAVMLLPLARARFAVQGNAPLDVMWQAILGLTDQLQRGRLAESEYIELCHHLKLELGEHLVSGGDRVRYQVSVENTQNTASSGTNSDATSTVINGATGEVIAQTTTNNTTTISIGGAQTGHIEETAEFRFCLHRHWSLFEALCHSQYVASKFTIWNAEGKNKLLELLAEIGVPLQQCKQHYQFMTPEFREQFRNQMNNTAILNKYQLQDPTVTYKSFCRFTSYKNPIAAADIVLAATALLELHGGDQQAQDPNTSAITSRMSSLKITAHDAFHEAYNLMGLRNDAIVKKGIQEALAIQRAIVRKASAMLDGQDSVHRHHRLYYAYIKNNFSTHSRSASSSTSEQSELELIFGRSNVLAKLGQFIMEVKRNQAKSERGWTGSNLLPLVLLSERADSTYLVMGISPFACPMGTTGVTEEQQNKLAPLINFRQFFKLAAADIHIKFRSNSFDPNVVEVRKEDAQDFLGALDMAFKRATPTFFKDPSDLQ